MNEMTKAYHFLKADMRANSGDERPWQIGETRTIEDVSRIKLCEYGYHSSPTLWDALRYANGPVACLVEVSESLGHDEDPAPKNVHATRRLLKAVNIDRELRLFAADCAERVLYLYEREYPDDRRPRLAIEAARDFANGKITAAHRDAARDAARAAARAAARDAAWDAARDAARAAAWDAAWAAARDAARDAARAAAWDAAWAAARDAAWAAARDAARAAAWDAARAAARAAERDWQRAHFNEMFGRIFEDK